MLLTNINGSWVSGEWITSITAIIMFNIEKLVDLDIEQWIVMCVTPTGKYS